jgi:hypothetical protein
MAYTTINTVNVTGAGVSGSGINSTMIGPIPASAISGAGTVTLTGAGGGIGGATGSTYNWNGAGGSGWNTTYTIGSSVGINGTYTVSSPTVSLSADNGIPLLKTAKSEINLDELADMMKLMQSLLVAVVADEEFAKRNPALADAAHDMLIKKLKE